MSTPLIQCQDLALGYETGLAVRHLTFTVNSGDYLCLVGENGSGKSTLVKGLLGLLAPVSGTIRFFGLSPREIGYLRGDPPGAGAAAGRHRISAPADPGPAGLPRHGI